MSSTTGEADKFSSLTSKHVCYHFSLDEIQSATNDFDDEVVIGKGGFGKVYKGSICIGETSHVVAIKRLESMSDQGALEFRNEIEMLSKLRHCHLVSLIGFCDDNKEMILVYEYMPHGTLDHHLHKADTPLNWVQRLKIALGAARGLDYLHTGVGTQHGVIHRDIKSSNILLDENWAAMISDFGLSKVGPTNQSLSNFDISVSVKGTFGYLDPEYFYTRRVTRKTDVFAFGVVLFELLSGRRAVDIRYGEEQCSLVRWAKKCVKDRKLYELIDYNIRGTMVPKCLTQFAQIAYRCVHSVLKERPSMTEVVASLQLLLELQEKHDNSAKSSGKMGFAWKIHKYLVPTTKQDSDQSGTSTQESLSIKEDGSDHGEMPLQFQLGDLKKFTYVELQCATRNFANTCRGVEEVFIGWVDKTTYSPSNDDTGLPIAIKRFGQYEHLWSGPKAKWLDLDVLKELSDHPNLVKLIGCCLRFKEVFLVYEFMPNENFEYQLHRGNITWLPLETKVKIVVGIARGMVFLEKKRAELMLGKVHQIRTISESWFDRHKAFMDEIQAHGLRYHNLDFKDYVGVSDDDNYQHFNPWSSKRHIQLQIDEIWGNTIDEYRLQRCKIYLDEDFTAKLSNYKGTDGEYEEDTMYVHGDYYPGFEPKPIDPLTLQHDVSGFTVVFMEVLIGKKISDKRYLMKTDNYLREHGKKSLRPIAELCFEICNEVDSESRMLTILEEYEDMAYYEDVAHYFLQ